MQRTIDLQKITIRLDSYDKRYNIIIVGLPETDNENRLNSLVLLLSRTGRTFTKDHFDIYYRVGNATQNKPRNIFIRLLRLGDRGFIIRNRYLIKQIQQYKIVWLNEDLTTLAPQERADLRSIFKAAKGLNVKLKPDVILLNGSKYTHSEIDKLPEGLTIEAASTVKPRVALLSSWDMHPFLTSTQPHSSLTVFSSNIASRPSSTLNVRQTAMK